MVYEISIPQSNQNNISIKDIIITILSNNWPLTSKKIFNIVKKSYNKNVTYQAIHKSINQLVNQNVVEKNKFDYKLNVNWIQQVKKFAINLEHQYENNTYKNDLFSNNLINTIQLKSFQELDILFMNYLKKNLSEFNKNETSVYSYWNHGWWPLLHLKDELFFLKKAKNVKNNYIIIKNKTTIDYWCSQFYSRLGMNIKTGINLECNYDFFSYNEYIFQIYCSLDHKERMDSFYNKIKEIKDIDIENLTKNLFEKETKIQVLIVRNPMIAKYLSTQMLKYF